jgi:hypothetical protein
MENFLSLAAFGLAIVSSNSSFLSLSFIPVPTYYALGRITDFANEVI